MPWKKCKCGARTVDGGPRCWQCRDMALGPARTAGAHDHAEPVFNREGRQVGKRRSRHAGRFEGCRP